MAPGLNRTHQTLYMHLPRGWADVRDGYVYLCGVTGANVRTYVITLTSPNDR